MSLPLISIIIPCRNEEKFIGKCLTSIILNDYPKDKLEVLVIDGMSEDGTREIVEKYVQQYPFVRLLDNPNQITPCALNIGIKNARGEIIMIMSAHAIYEKEYISKCIKYLEEYDADNVGGIMVTLPREETIVGKAIISSLSSRFGVGNSAFRTGSKEIRWVDTVFGGCYKREVFNKVGLFNEDLASTQDMEFNLRLKRAGGKILLHPDIVCYYYTRSDFKSFCKNNFRNGVWAILPFKYTNIMPVSLRHLVPLTFVLSLVGTLGLWSLLSLVGSSGFLGLLSSLCLWLFFLIVGVYLLTNIYFSSKITLKEKNFKHLLIMPIIFATLHIGYGLGSVLGFAKCVISKQSWKNLKSILKNRGMRNSCQRS